MEILHIEDLSFRYPKCEKYALENINLSVESGEFIVICGRSGCGKTTLLRILKRELSPAGEKSGKITYRGTDTDELCERDAAADIGFVMQNPDSQIVTDKVWHELAFGLENLGVPTETIRRRVGEMASYFGIADWFRKSTDELSGGQKQLLNLASVMVMQPKILLLDEPTGQLDPIAAADFIATVQKLNRELGLTVILVEHRLEDVFPAADRVLMLEDGRTLLCDTPRGAGKRLRELDGDHPMLLGLPAAMRVYGALSADGDSDTCPLTVREGRDYLEKNFAGCAEPPLEGEYIHSDEVAAELKNVWFRYEKDLDDVMRGTSLKVYRGEAYCILGGNGTGKTTTLSVLAGLRRAYRGKVLVFGKPVRDYRGNSLYRNNLALLPQNPQTVFTRDTVRADLCEILEVQNIQKDERERLISEISEKMGITPFLDRHPYDLSGGEVQKCAIAKILLTRPRILLLDEPTKGLDAAAKKSLTAMLRRLRDGGVTLITVTHDVEFAAGFADRCGLFFDGEIISSDVPAAFFSQNSFYTTAANRMARSLFPHAITAEDVVKCCRNGEKA